MYFQWYYPNLQLFKFINAAKSDPDEPDKSGFT